MIEPAQALLGLLIAIGVWAFLLAAVLLGGGVAAVRRQRRVLALLAVVLIAIAVATPVLEQLSGGVIGIALLGVSVLWIGAGIVQRRREPVEVQVRRAAVMRTPRVRWLIVLLVAFVVLISVLAAVLGRMSSQ
jgi:hypothetical protein